MGGSKSKEARSIWKQKVMFMTPIQTGTISFVIFGLACGTVVMMKMHCEKTGDMPTVKLCIKKAWESIEHFIRFCGITKGAAAGVDMPQAKIEILEEIVEQGDTTFFETPPELEKVVENVDCIFKDRWADFLVKCKELHLAAQLAISFAVGLIFGGILALIDKGMRSLFSNSCSKFLKILIKVSRPGLPDSTAEKMAYSFVSKFITTCVFATGIIGGAIVVFVVTCSLPIALAFAAGASFGIFGTHLYSASNNEQSRYNQMNTRFIEEGIEDINIQIEQQKKSARAQSAA